MEKKHQIGIIGLGWLGFPLAEALSSNYEILGTCTTKEKQQKIAKHFQKVWVYESLANQQEILSNFSNISCLILTLPARAENYVSQIKEIIAHLPKDQKVIFTSSIGIYEDQSGIIDEDNGQLKNGKLLDAENYLKAQFKEKLSILRLGGLIGKGRNPIFSLQNKMVSGKNAAVNLIHQADIIRAIQHILTNEIWGTTYNLVFPNEFTKKDYYEQMAFKYNLNAPSFDSTVLERKIIGLKFANDTGFQYQKHILDE